MDYWCCICKGTMPLTGPQEHRLDPCGLVIVGNVVRDWRDQREQTYYCHFECFRRLIDNDAVLYINDEDFETNGETEAALESEEAAGQQDPDSPEPA